jgi:hypothetical protein
LSPGENQSNQQFCQSYEILPRFRLVFASEPQIDSFYSFCCKIKDNNSFEHSNRRILFDGSFQVPLEFAQMVELGFDDRKFSTVAYGMLKDKKASSYKYFLEWLFGIMKSKGIDLAEIYFVISIDLEAAIISTFKEMFSKSVILCCDFHLLKLLNEHLNEDKYLKLSQKQLQFLNRLELNPNIQNTENYNVDDLKKRKEMRDFVTSVIRVILNSNGYEDFWNKLNVLNNTSPIENFAVLIQFHQNSEQINGLSKEEIVFLQKKQFIRSIIAFIQTSEAKYLQNGSYGIELFKSNFLHFQLYQKEFNWEQFDQQSRFYK